MQNGLVSRFAEYLTDPMLSRRSVWKLRVATSAYQVESELGGPSLIRGTSGTMVAPWSWEKSWWFSWDPRYFECSHLWTAFVFFGGQGCPCALVLLRQEWFATLFLDIRALRRTDLFDGVAVKHHMINAVHVTEAQKHCLRMLTLLDKLINWESFMLFHHFSTFFNRKCVYIGGSFPSNDVRLLETCRLTRSLGLAIGEDSGIIAEPQVEHMQCGENLIHWITCIIYVHV